MRRPTPLDRITREGRPKNLGNRHRTRPGGRQRHHPARRPSLSGVQAERIDMSGRNADVPPGLRGKTAQDFREHVIAHARPAPQAPVALQTCAFFSSPAGCTSPFCARPPFQMTHAGFHRKTTQIRPQLPKKRRRQSSAARNGACSPLRRVFRLGLSDESRVHPSPFPPLHGNACAATLPYRKPSAHSFLESPPKIMLVSAARGFQHVYFFTNKEQNAPSQQKKQCE